MLRRPAGWHLGAGSLPAVGTAPQRFDAESQRAYWRRTVAELHAGASAAVLLPTLFSPSPGIGLAGGPVLQQQTVATVRVGPQAVGERWDVALVAVQAASQVSLPPLVIQQVAAQQAGTTVTPPPPIVARVWRAVAGQPVHLLAATNAGGYDTVGVSCPPLSAGESILVVWYGAQVGDSVQAIVKGTKYALSVT